MPLTSTFDIEQFYRQFGPFGPCWNFSGLATCVCFLTLNFLYLDILELVVVGWGVGGSDPLQYRPSLNGIDWAATIENYSLLNVKCNKPPNLDMYNSNRKKHKTHVNQILFLLVSLAFIKLKNSCLFSFPSKFLSVFRIPSIAFPLLISVPEESSSVETNPSLKWV